MTYEAGPTGFGLARAFAAAGVRCEVAAPSKIVRPAGDRVKTDARDAMLLARLLRMDEISAGPGTQRSARKRPGPGAGPGGRPGRSMMAHGIGCRSCCCVTGTCTAVAKAWNGVHDSGCAGSGSTSTARSGGGHVVVGDDWAEDHHDVEIVDESGRMLARRRFPEGLAGITRLHALIAEHRGACAVQSSMCRESTPRWANASYWGTHSSIQMRNRDSARRCLTQSSGHQPQGARVAVGSVPEARGPLSELTGTKLPPR